MIFSSTSPLFSSNSSTAVFNKEYCFLLMASLYGKFICSILLLYTTRKPAAVISDMIPAKTTRKFITPPPLIEIKITLITIKINPMTHAVIDTTKKQLDCFQILSTTSMLFVLIILKNSSFA